MLRKCVGCGGVGAFLWRPGLPIQCFGLKNFADRCCFRPVLIDHLPVTAAVDGRSFCSNWSCIRGLRCTQQYTWVISKVLHAVRFLFKNEFILQNTFTGLQCNLHCALSERSNVLGKSCIPVGTPSLLMRLITRVTSLDTSSTLLKRFPRSGFFNFGNKSMFGGLMSGLYGGWGSTCHPYFSKISETAPEA